MFPTYKSEPSSMKFISFLLGVSGTHRSIPNECFKFSHGYLRNLCLLLNSSVSPFVVIADIFNLVSVENIRKMTDYGKKLTSTA